MAHQRTRQESPLNLWFTSFGIFFAPLRFSILIKMRLEACSDEKFSVVPIKKNRNPFYIILKFVIPYFLCCLVFFNINNKKIHSAIKSGYFEWNTTDITSSIRFPLFFYMHNVHLKYRIMTILNPLDLARIVIIFHFKRDCIKEISIVHIWLWSMWVCME